MQKYCCDDCKKMGAKKIRQAERTKRKPSTSVRDVAKKAREQGLTYGQYVAKIGL